MYYLLLFIIADCKYNNNNNCWFKWIVDWYNWKLIVDVKLLMDPNIVNSSNALALNEKDMKRGLRFTLSPI